MLTGVVGDEFMHCDTFAGHGLVSSKNKQTKKNRCDFPFSGGICVYILILLKKSSFFGMCVLLFSISINKLLVNFQVECIELQSDVQLKEKSDHVFIRIL